MIASAAFIRLLNEWPDYARKAHFDADIASMQAKGTALKNALTGISTDAATQRSNRALYGSLIGRSVPADAVDVNGDGAVTVSDVQLVINQVMGLAPKVSDLNADGT